MARTALKPTARQSEPLVRPHPDELRLAPRRTRGRLVIDGYDDVYVESSLLGYQRHGVIMIVFTPVGNFSASPVMALIGMDVRQVAGR